MSDLKSLIEDNLNKVEFFVQQQKWDEAKELLETVLSIAPNSIKAMQLYAIVLYIKEKYEDSLEILLKVIDLDKSVINYSNLSLCYLGLKQSENAIQALEKALEIEPENADAHVSLGYAYFTTGEWEKGWVHLKLWTPSKKFDTLFSRDKQWNGESLEGKKIILYCEQGYGDFIHFIRFAPKLKELGAEVFIGVTDPLASLFKDFGKLVTKSSNVNIYDYHCSVCSLPYLLKVYANKCTETIPYFHVDKLNLSKYKDNFKIGITWTGNSNHPQNQIRSCQLNDFKNISEIPNVKLFSLQKDVPIEGIDAIDMSEYMTDFKETARIIQAMDLIITVDTCILHIAGALNKETWALIAFNPDWRWTLHGDKTVWYDSVTLFRQEEPKNWDSVFTKVESKLNERLEKFN